MKRVTVIVILALTALFFTTTTISATVSSLRGEQALDENSKKPAKKKVMAVEGGIERNFEKQPPMIPHTTDKYIIDLRNNGCMKCHSEKTYEKEKAPKVGDSHYITRDGKQLKTVSSRRYFCNQCHATQVEAQPLVQNIFEGAK